MQQIVASLMKDKVMLIDYGNVCDIAGDGDISIPTRYYRSPEQLLCSVLDRERPLSVHADWWSLACTLFELYTGVILFNTDSYDDNGTVLDMVHMRLVIELFTEEELDMVCDKSLLKHMKDIVQRMAATAPEGVSAKDDDSVTSAELHAEEQRESQEAWNALPPNVRSTLLSIFARAKNV